MSSRLRPTVVLLARLLLAAVFGVAGALKLADPSAFATQIANYHLFPATAPVVAATLPVLELILATALLLGPVPWRRAAAVASLPVLLAFLIAVTAAYARGIDIDCGCFGSGGGKIGPLTIARNAGLLLAATTLLWLDRYPKMSLTVTSSNNPNSNTNPTV